MDFLNFTPIPENGVKDYSSALYKNLMKQVGKNKVEKNRFGGSSGLCQVDNNFWNMLRSPGSFPRRASAVMLHKNKSQRSWFYHYISEQNQLCGRKYSPPVVGGKFTTSPRKKSGLKTRELFSCFPIMVKFVLTKPLCALILDNLNSSDTFPFNINPVAVAVELSHIKSCDELGSFFTTKRPDHEKKMFDFAVHYSDNFLKYTVVEHPTGMHRDTFERYKICLNESDHSDVVKKSTPIPSLENKMCFEDYSRKHLGPGRGGSDNAYVWALLDWEGPKTAFREVFTNENNLNRPFGANHYGGVNATLNRQRRMDFYLANPDLRNQLPDPNNAWN